MQPLSHDGWPTNSQRRSAIAGERAAPKRGSRNGATPTAATSGAQKDDWEWGCVQQIPAHRKITVHLRSGDVLKGIFVETSSGELMVIGSDNQTRNVSRHEIQRIGTNSRAKGAMWGALIGFGIGAPMGARIARTATHQPATIGRPAQQCSAGSLGRLAPASARQWAVNTKSAKCRL
jgi:hypothetical protein